MTENRKPKPAQSMAARRRRRRRTYALSIPLSLRLRRSRAKPSTSESRAAEGAQSGTLRGSRLLASGLVVAMAAVLVWFAMDTQFYVFDVEISGTSLVDPREVSAASGLEGYSVFHIDTAAAADQIRLSVPGVERAFVTCRLPDRLVIHIQESDAHFCWESMGSTFLVDGQGHVLQASDEPIDGLLLIHDLDDHRLKVGDKVNPSVLGTVEQLHAFMPEARSFEHSQALGVSLQDARGWRIHFGDAEALPEKVASLNVLLQQISKRGEVVRLIDLRFVGSPYYE
jgi:cell division septal protein FtsQ